MNQVGIMSHMRTVGQVLKEAREAKFYSLEDVEKNIKIRRELLEALESDDFAKLPPATFVQGFIKNYGKFLNLDSNKLLAIFRRDYEAKKHPPLILESFRKPLKNQKMKITPPTILGVVVALIVFGFFAYLWVEYRQFVGAPNLEISSPVEGQTVEIPTVVVEGKTDSEARVSVNDQNVGVDSEGKFKEEVKLSSSTNIITISAVSRFGQATKIQRTVFVKK